VPSTFRARSPRVLVVLTAVLAVLTALAAPALAGGRGRGLGPIDEPDALGPWAVGRTTFTVPNPDVANRVLTVDAWYPVDAEDAGGPASAYDLIFAQLPSEVAQDEPPVSSQGPFPLAVFSHGSNGIRFQSFFLAEQLASHGFLVVAPDHIGNTAIDLLLGSTVPFPLMRLLRVSDVSRLVDAMLARSADPDDFFAGAVDPERIGVTGHSFGAFTALGVAAGVGPVPADPRVDAIAPIAPAAGSLGDEDLGRIEIPLLVLGGTADTITPVDPESIRTFSLVESRPRYRVDVLEAGHNSPTNICDLAEVLIGVLPPELLAFLLGNLDQGCAPELIEPDEAHRVTNLYVVAFMKRFVAGDPRYNRYLTHGRVHSRDLPVDFFAVHGD